MILPDMTARTPLGAVDLVPLMRREAGFDARVPDDEKEAGVFALARMGWGLDRIHRATGLHHDVIRDLIAGRHKRAQKRPRRSRIERYRKRLAQRVMVDGRWFHPDAPHGTDNAYSNYGCRCISCGDAHREKGRKYS